MVAFLGETLGKHGRAFSCPLVPVFDSKGGVETRDLQGFLPIVPAHADIHGLPNTAWLAPFCALR
jgi:hypothetical protein